MDIVESLKIEYVRVTGVIMLFGYSVAYAKLIFYFFSFFFHYILYPFPAVTCRSPQRQPLRFDYVFIRQHVLQGKQV